MNEKQELVEIQQEKGSNLTLFLVDVSIK